VVRRWVMTAAACVGIGLGVALADGGSGEEASAPQGVLEALAFKDLKWERLVPELGDASPELAFVPLGDQSHGTQRYIRSSRKFHIPRHWHSANETAVTLRGSMAFTCDRCDSQVAQVSGDLSYIPARCVHQAWMGEDTVVFVTTDGPWDLNWSEGPPTADDVGVDPPAREGAK
jgi:hypothetical protein